MRSRLGYVKHYRELEVYKKQRELSREVFLVTKRFPTEEKYSLTDQFRRASRSIGAQLAEAWGKRLYPKHFVSKLSDADSEQLETQHWIQVALDCSYIDANTHQQVDTLCLQIGKMLGSMIRKADAFSGDTSHRLSDEVSPYLTHARASEH